LRCGYARSRLIAKSYDRRGAGRSAKSFAVTAAMQESALQTEEALLDSRRAIAGSRKLLEATRQLRDAVASRLAANGLRQEAGLPKAAPPSTRLEVPLSPEASQAVIDAGDQQADKAHIGS
jgi:hypothetical protein